MTILTAQSVSTCVIIIGSLMLATALVVALLYYPAPEEKSKEPEAAPLSPTTQPADVEQGDKATAAE